MTHPDPHAATEPAPPSIPALAPRSVPALAPRSIPAPVPSGSGAVDEALVVWRTLVALGIRHAAVSPGSRSAPLVYALEDPEISGRLQAHVRIDERAAAFTALGISRRTPASPGVVVTTSGTATAHLHAAVLEAHHSRTPLIVLTADRPVELRDVGANQATHQAGLYGDAVRFAADLPAPARAQANAVELRTAASTMARAVAAATGPYPGPVHVNLGLRDPLVPVGGAVPGARARRAEDADGAANASSVAGADGAPQGSGAAASAGSPAERITVTRRLPPHEAHPVRLVPEASAVVVAGDRAGQAARAFAEAHHLPLLAEPSSGSRGGPCAIPAYPRLLARVMGEEHHPLRPRQAIVFGHPTLSRPVVGALLGASDVETIIVDPTHAWADASRRASLVVPALAPAPEEDEDPVLAEARRASLTAWLEQSAIVAAEETPSWQARAALAVWEATGPDDALVLGSSSLVRDLEQLAPAARGPVIASRGLAGIDGMAATASGYALAAPSAGRVRLLVGDVTALHDLTGLVIGPAEEQPELDIVVVDDGGGRIFSGLEHREARPGLLERFFTTPHGTDIAAAARALGVPSRQIGGAGAPAELAALLAHPVEGRRMIVVGP